MKVILLQDIKGVGKKDEVINASDGYARNFLLPKKMGIEANAENMSKLKAKQDSNQYKKSVEKEKAQEIAEKLKNITLKISVKSGENQKIFGSITAKEIAENLKEQYKIEIDKKKIDLKEVKGMGGTNFQVPADYYAEHKSEYSGMIIFTDGDGEPPQIDGCASVLWILDSRINFEKSRQWITKICNCQATFLPF